MTAERPDRGRQRTAPGRTTATWGRGPGCPRTSARPSPRSRSCRPGPRRSPGRGRRPAVRPTQRRSTEHAHVVEDRASGAIEDDPADGPSKGGSHQPERASKAANAGQADGGDDDVTRPATSSGDRMPSRAGRGGGSSRRVADNGGPGGEGAARHDEGEDPRASRRPGARVEGREGQHDHAGIADDRVADDVLQVVLDPGGERRQHDRRDGDGDDDRALRRRRRRGAARSTRPPRPVRRWPARPGPRR